MNIAALLNQVPQAQPSDATIARIGGSGRSNPGNGSDAFPATLERAAVSQKSEQSSGSGRSQAESLARSETSKERAERNGLEAGEQAEAEQAFDERADSVIERAESEPQSDAGEADEPRGQVEQGNTIEPTDGDDAEPSPSADGESIENKAGTNGAAQAAEAAAGARASGSQETEARTRVSDEERAARLARNLVRSQTSGSQTAGTETQAAASEESELQAEANKPRQGAAAERAAQAEARTEPGRSGAEALIERADDAAKAVAESRRVAAEKTLSPDRVLQQQATTPDEGSTEHVRERRRSVSDVFRAAMASDEERSTENVADRSRIREQKPTLEADDGRFLQRSERAPAPSEESNRPASEKDADHAKAEVIQAKGDVAAGEGWKRAVTERAEKEPKADIRAADNGSPARVDARLDAEPMPNTDTKLRTGVTQPDGIESKRAEAVRASAVQGLEAAVKQRGGRIVVKLSPPIMGDLTITMKLVRGVANVQIEASTEAAAKALTQSLDQLRGALEARGVKVDSLNVQHAANTPQSGPGHQQPQQQQSSNQQQNGSFGQQSQHDASDGQSRGRDDQSNEHARHHAGEHTPGSTASDQSMQDFLRRLRLTVDARA